MRGIDALCECRDEREGRCVAGLRGGRGPRQCRGGGGASLVKDFGGSVRTSGLDDLLLWPHRLFLLCLTLAHMDNHAGGGLCPCMELVFFTWKSWRGEGRDGVNTK